MEDETLLNNGGNGRKLTDDLPIKGHGGRRWAGKWLPIGIIVGAGVLGFVIPFLNQPENDFKSTSVGSTTVDDDFIPASEPKNEVVHTKTVEKEFAVVKGNDLGYLNVRADASTSSAKLGQLNIGDKVEVTGRSPEWIKVKLPEVLGGKSEGWIAESYVDIVKEKVELRE